MGPVHTGHDEAAMNHMMAERRRRVKQKENFSALRRLVPIISKVTLFSYPKIIQLIPLFKFLFKQSIVLAQMKSLFIV
jgi:hypothetical protein